MTSVFYAIGIMCSIFWMVFIIKNRFKMPTYSRNELVVFYLFARVVPIVMLQQHNIHIWINILMEIVVFVLWSYYVKRKKEQNVQGVIYASYIFQPCVIIAILSGNHWYMLVNVLLLLLLGVADVYVKKRNGSLRAFLPEYIVGSVGMFVWLAATEIHGQKLSDINSQTEIPVLYIVSLAIMVVAAIVCLYRFWKGEYVIDRESEEVEINNGCCCWETKEKPIEVKDILLMLLFTICFTIIVLFRIGSFRVPETFLALAQGENATHQIVLDFDSDVEVDKVYIYLGYRGKREISFSSMTEQNPDWTVFASRHEVTSAFSWNEIKVNQTLNKLGMVLMAGDARIHEVVLLDKHGNRLMPSNSTKYSELFDEQALFPANRTYFYRTMFDEVYHARTAYEFLHQLPIYENTHPPLGKSIISIGINAFGMNPFGWRIMCALCGILMVPIMYLFAHKMFGSTKAASVATILLSTEFMHFSLSRIATLDIIVALFVLMMFYFMYCFVKSCGADKDLKQQFGWLFLCGGSMALAISSKWTGIYAAAGIAVIFFTFLWNQMGGIQGVKENRTYLIKLFVCCCVCFIAIPLVIYVLSYIPFTRVYTDKGLIKSAIDNAHLMLTYHADTVFEHPYSSEWYEWLWNKQPLLDSRTSLKDGTISVIATFGNPLVVWAGLLSVFHQFYLWRCKKCKNAQYLIFAYASVMLPWLFIHRTVFIYQYSLGVMILILMIVNSICHFKVKSRLLVITSLISIGLFVLFYPVISGLAVEPEYLKVALEWMESWIFAYR